MKGDFFLIFETRTVRFYVDFDTESNGIIFDNLV